MLRIFTDTAANIPPHLLEQYLIYFPSKLTSLVANKSDSAAN